MTRAGRWLAAVLLAVLLAGLSAASVAGAWARTVLFDTDRYVATVAPLVDEPAIQQALSEQLADQVVGAVQAEIDQLPLLLQQPLRALSDQLEPLVEDVASTLVASEEFAEAWEGANRSAHAQLVASLTGDSTAVQVREDQVSIRAQAFADVAQAALAEAGFDRVAALIPPVQGSFVVLQSDALPAVQAALDLLDRAGSWLWLVAAAVALAVVLVAPRRLAGAAAATGAVAAGAGLLALGLMVLRQGYLQSTSALSTQAKAAVFDQVSALLWTSTVTVLAASAALALALGIAAVVISRYAGPESRPT